MRVPTSAAVVKKAGALDVLLRVFWRFSVFFFWGGVLLGLLRVVFRFSRFFWCSLRFSTRFKVF